MKVVHKIFILFLFFCPQLILSQVFDRGKCTDFSDLIKEWKSGKTMFKITCSDIRNNAFEMFMIFHLENDNHFEAYDISDIFKDKVGKYQLKGEYASEKLPNDYFYFTIYNLTERSLNITIKYHKNVRTYSFKNQN